MGGSLALLPKLGAQPPKPSRYKPISIFRFLCGYYTNRNPLRSPLSAFYSEGWGIGNADGLLDPSLNVEVSPRLTLIRRPGFLQYSTQTIPGPVTGFYSFRQVLNISNPIDLIVDSTGAAYKLTPTTISTVYTKSSGAGPAKFLGIGNTLYIADGVDLLAWVDGGSGTNPRNWGISISETLTSATAGTGSTTGSGFIWINPSNVTGSSGYASGAVSGTEGTRVLTATNFGFALSAGVLGGISISFGAYTTVPGGVLTVGLFYGTSFIGSLKTVSLGTSPATITLGSDSDTWGVSNLNAALVNNSGFGVAFIGNGGVDLLQYEINDVQMTTYAGAGAPVVTPTGSGSVSVTSGWQYCYAYANSNCGDVSSTTPVSATTGAFTNKAYVGVALVASTDPQVTGIWVFRTNDGGSLLYALPNSPYPNTTATIQDTTPDISLNILAPAPINNVNNPPPPGAQDPVYWQDRVWVHVGNILYASGGPDTLVGNGNESFPPLNYWSFPSPIVRKIATTSGLALFFTDGVGMMVLPSGLASNTDNYAPLILLNGIGLANWNAVDTNGLEIYMFTSENQFVSLTNIPSAVLGQTPLQVNEIGFSIQDKLVSVSPLTASVARHHALNDRGIFVADGVSTWYKCVPFPQPDYTITGSVWSPPGQFQTLPLSIFASVETSPGVKTLLCGQSASGAVLYRDSSYGTFLDNGVAYDAYMTIGSIVLAHPGEVAELGFITSEFIKTGSLPSISTLLNEVSGTFLTLTASGSDPWQVYGVTLSPQSVYASRYPFRQGNAPQVLARHMQQRIDFGTDTVMNEMISNTIWGTIIEEVAP